MGAHVARLVRAPTLALTLLILLSCSFCSSSVSDVDALLKLKDSFVNTAALANWNPSTSPPCNGKQGNWVGVLCWNGHVWGLLLDGKALSGVIDIDSLLHLPYLRKLSFRNNNFNGSFPQINKIISLKSLFLSHNHFSGQIPDDAFVGMTHFKKLYLSNNQFQGRVPSSLATLPKLLEVRIDGNQFEGQIPDFQQQGLRVMNVSNNQLEGPIPAKLNEIDASSFTGNKNLCGHPLESCESKAKKAYIIKIIILVIVIVLLLTAIVVLLIILNKKKQKSLLTKSPSFDTDIDKATSYTSTQAVVNKSTEKSGSMNKAVAGKLSFVRDDRERFDLQDLLRASAEVLGSGTFGASYKAVILNGQALVVKRYKQMSSVGREDFHEHMRRLGRLRHPNLLPLVAYYYRKEEKLLVFDFIQNGSLASHLHGNHTMDQPVLDWPTRLKIIKGVVKGLAYLYAELPSLVVPHGHLKSSNVVLQESFEPLLTDYALTPMINTDHAHIMIAYKSPECVQRGQTTKKTDVWCLGILILEILTGKFPENYLLQNFDTNADLATWVNTMVKEKQTDDVFDKEMVGTKDCKGKMIQLLKIGLGCCEEDVATRLELKEVMEKIEELNERDIDEYQHPSNIADSKGNVHEFIDM